MTEVVKFNIGGHRYEVSRSLLQMHPLSMLAKSASDQWQEDPEAEIFVERNGSRFQYVLDYLRDGSVTLPITEAKEALVKELEYYGIDVNEDTIDDTAMHKAKSFKSLGIAMTDLQDCVTTLKTESYRTELEYRYAQLALDCIKYYLQVSVPYRKGQSHQLASNLNKDDEALKNIGALMTLVNDDDEKAREGANVHLRSVGLSLSAYQTTWNGFYINSSGKSVRGIHCYDATLEEIDVMQMQNE